MPVFAANIDLQSREPNFKRDRFATLAEMKAYPETSVDDGHISFCKEDGQHYEFQSSNTVDTVTGRWRVWGSGTGCLSADATKTMEEALTASASDAEHIFFPTDYTEVVYGGKVRSHGVKDLNPGMDYSQGAYLDVSCMDADGTVHNQQTAKYLYLPHLGAFSGDPRLGNDFSELGAYSSYSYITFSYLSDGIERDYKDAVTHLPLAVALDLLAKAIAEDNINCFMARDGLMSGDMAALLEVFFQRYLSQARFSSGTYLPMAYDEIKACDYSALLVNAGRLVYHTAGTLDLNTEPLSGSVTYVHAPAEVTDITGIPEELGAQEVLLVKDTNYNDKLRVQELCTADCVFRRTAVPNSDGVLSFNPWIEITQTVR